MISEEKQKALEAALGNIEKQFGKGSVMKLGDSSSHMQVEAVPTGCLSLDIALGVGGVPKGRIVEIYGPESSGKTTVALHMVAEVQKRGGIAGFIDAEHALDPVYAKNIGVMAVTKVYSVQVIGGAAVLSICCSFLGKLAALISTIPGPVIGGISFLLYGMIGTSGLRMLVDNHVDYSKSRNLTLTSVVFVVGLSGIALKLGNVELTGMVLACVVAMALSLVFYVLDKLKLTNDQ